ncbi:MAG: tetratricopeptide repeat protein [Bacillota bacterium]
MTEVNLQNASQQPSINPPTVTGKTKKGNFTIRQSIVMILLTLFLTTGGWYIVGKLFVWVDMDMKRVNEQMEFYKQKVMSEPNNAKARVELGYTYYLKDKNSEAIKEFNQALVIDQNFFDAYYNLGVVLIKEKRYNEALEKLTKAIELSPRDFKGHLQLGIAYRELGMYEEAMESLDKSNKLNPTNADIIYQIGKVAEAQGDKEMAIDIYKEVLTYDPLFKPAIESLERLQKN